jgi:hypothetical protein
MGNSAALNGVSAIYGVYILLVTWKGNAQPFLDNMQRDGPGYLPWLISVVVLYWLHSIESTKKMADAFIVLALITLVLMRFSTIKSQFKSLYSGISLMPNSNPASAPTQLTPSQMNALSTPSASAPAQTTNTSGANAPSISQNLLDILNQSGNQNFGGMMSLLN